MILDLNCIKCNINQSNKNNRLTRSRQKQKKNNERCVVST